jgi:hypothetical protein
MPMRARLIAAVSVAVGGCGLAVVGACTALNPLGYLQAGCEAAQVSCGSGCADLQTNVVNCGACGHDCLGGGCSQGECMPVVVASGQSGPWDIAVNATDLYFTNNTSDGGSVVRCPLSGCDAGMQIVAADRPSPDRVVLDSTNVYWTEHSGGNVQSCPLSGCGVGPLTLATQQTSATGIALDSSNVYWGTDTDDGGLWSCPLAGCAPRGPFSVSTTSNPITIRVADGGLYWATAQNNDVWSCPTAGCSAAVTQLAHKQPSPYSLAIHNGIVYFTNTSAPGNVLACSVDGCGSSPTLIATDISSYGIAVDDSGVYWTTQGPLGAVRMCPPPPGGCPGGTPRTLASGLSYPFGIALTQAAIYWTNAGTGHNDGAVMKLAKPPS